MYSTPSVAGADYLKETGAGWYAQTRAELKDCILQILNDEVVRTKDFPLQKRFLLQTIMNIIQEKSLQNYLYKLLND